MNFYLSMECRNCDADIYYGLCVTTLEHADRPVVPYDIAAQTTFCCEECGAQYSTGDLDDLWEELPGHEDDDEDDEDAPVEAGAS